MHNVANSFSLPFKDPNWFTTFLLIGLINLIPIVGTLNTYGWMLSLLDNYRQGRTDLPPAGFHYLNRGINLFVVVFVLGLVLVVILMVPFFLLFAAALGTAAAKPDMAGNPGTSLAFGAGFQGYALGINLLSLVIYFVLPPLIIATERGGIGGGLSPVRIWSVAAANWGNTLVAGVLFGAAALISGLGIFACCVGIMVTLPYAQAVMAGVVRFYEATFEPRQALPQEPGPPQALA